MTSVAFIGLGNMGYPMAGHLAKSGHSVAVFNRTLAKSERWKEDFGGRVARTPADAASDAEFVFLCVGNDDDVREVVAGEQGVCAALTHGAVIVDHTTTSASLARELATLAAKTGVHFVDAPVSGGQAGAENGALTVMCGGNSEAYALVEPVIACYARACRLMGEVGAGQLTKMVNQVCVAGVLQGLSEGLHFGQRAGLDMEAVVDVISKGAAQSWQMENRAESMCAGEFDFGFAVDWMRKDLGIVLDEASRQQVSMPATEMIDGFYAQLQDMGGHRWDTSSLIELLRRG